MILRCVSPQEYAQALTSTRFAYDSTAFSQLNRQKAASVLYIIGYYEPVRPLMGITVGYDGEMWRCPFSAPFGTPLYRRELSLGDIYDFFTELSHLLGNTLRITLPAALHADSMLTKVTGSLNSLAAKRIDDFNFHYPLPLTPEQALGRMSAAARRNLRRAIASGLELVPCTDVAAAYSIIEAHHAAKGYRMAMTMQSVEDTADVVPTDLFTVRHQGQDIAAVYLHHVSEDTVQLINWGDLPGYQTLRPMNFMAYALAMHYSRQGLKAFDLGPASTAGIPNAGLCRFKEEIGCDITLKPTFLIPS